MWFDDDEQHRRRDWIGWPDLEAWRSDLGTCLRASTRLKLFDSRSAQPHHARAARALPVAGLWFGAITALALAFGWLVGLTTIVAATLAVAVSALVTGALREDGLAATADALGSPGAANPERRDGQIAVFGVLAIGLILLLRVGAITGIIGRGGLVTAILVVMSAEAISYAASVWPRWFLAPARTGSAGFSVPPEDAAVHRCLILAGLIAFLFTATAVGVLATSFALATTLLAAMGMTSLARLRFGGHNEELSSATQQVCLAAFLAATLAALPA